MAPGINGKMNEVQAAFGLLQLKHIDHAIEQRKGVYQRYVEALTDQASVTLLYPPAEVEYNYSYFPILVEVDYPISRDQLYERLRKSGIYARRYFFPLISDMPMYRGLPSAAASNLSVAKSIAERILCLPIYPKLSEDDQQRVINIIQEGV